MRYRFIQNHVDEFPVIVMCRVLKVTSSGYYAWRIRPLNARAVARDQLTKRIVQIHEESRQTYGSPRIHRQLVDEDQPCSVNHVAKLMQEAGIRAKMKCRFKVTTKSSNNHQPAPNLLNRQFNRDEPNNAWVGDITYIRTGEGWLSLAVVLDLYSRRVVGWAMSDRMTSQIVESALSMAIGLRQPGPGLLHHSDRGSQYTGADYQTLLSKHGLQCSMSRKGNCWDNAVIESFFGTLKCELIAFEHYRTRQQARQSIFEYIEVFYNRYRRHSAIGYVSPAEFEQRHEAAA